MSDRDRTVVHERIGSALMVLSFLRTAINVVCPGPLTEPAKSELRRSLDSLQEVEKSLSEAWRHTL